MIKMTSNNSSSQLNISLSREHKDYISEVKKVFGELNPKVEANLIRESGEELPLQIIIFISKAVAINIAWDLLKIGIENLFDKFSKPNVIIRDSKSTMYSVQKDFTINVVVPPEKKEEYEHIEDFNDLKEHLKNQDKNKKHEDISLSEE